MSKNKYRAYTSRHLDELVALGFLPASQRFVAEVVSEILPFRVNPHVLEALIDPGAGIDDPLYRLMFPHRDMLITEHFAAMAELVEASAPRRERRALADAIRAELNPHPAGQLELNQPRVGSASLVGMQHKYRETLLYFPSQGQTCHAYCSFCFRWPQFVGMTQLKQASRDLGALREYLIAHPEISDLLLTGGDPLIMRTQLLERLLLPLLEDPQLAHVQTIRIGTKSPSYWPYRFTEDDDAEDLLRLFERVVASGRQLALMLHINHPRELESLATQEALRRIRSTGAVLRGQAPLLRHVNDDAAIWARLLREEVRQGILPYYMFIPRDTGAQHYFGVALRRAWSIFTEAYREVSGLARGIRGPVMSCTPGKVHVLGPQPGSEDVWLLQFLQARQPDWVRRPFAVRMPAGAIWVDQLEAIDALGRSFLG